MANEQKPITPEELKASTGVLVDIRKWVRGLCDASLITKGARDQWVGSLKHVDEKCLEAASTIRDLRASLAETDELKIADGWEPRGQSEMRCVRLNRKVYLAGSEGWRVSCLCATASAHVRAVEEGTCKTGLYTKPFENWRDAIRAAEEADHAD